MTDKKPRRVFDKRFKLNVVMRYLDGYGGSRFIGQEFGIRHSMVERWVQAYREHGEAGLEPQRGKHPKPKGPRPKDPESEVLRLKAEIDYLKKLIALKGGIAPKS